MKLGYTCQPQFRITQHERDLVVLERIIQTLGCGNLVKPSSGRDRYDISVANIQDISTIIIPFFQNYSLYGAKSLDFLSFLEGISIMEKKGASYSLPRKLAGVAGRFGSIKVISLQYEYIQKVLKFLLFYTLVGSRLLVGVCRNLRFSRYFNIQCIEIVVIPFRSASYAYCLLLLFNVVKICRCLRT
jgi:hypothetical protein